MQQKGGGKGKGKGKDGKISKPSSSNFVDEDEVFYEACEDNEDGDEYSDDEEAFNAMMDENEDDLSDEELQDAYAAFHTAKNDLQTRRRTSSEDFDRTTTRQRVLTAERRTAIARIVARKVIGMEIRLARKLCQVKLQRLTRQSRNRSQKDHRGEVHQAPWWWKKQNQKQDRKKEFEVC